MDLPPALWDLIRFFRLWQRQRHSRLLRVPTLRHLSKDELIADWSFAPMLADIYRWFTEGFDTADLNEAKALLDELGA